APPDSVRWSIWPSGARVTELAAAPAEGRAAQTEPETPLSPEAPPTRGTTPPGYHSNARENAMRVLYAPEPTLASELVAAPIGMVEVSVPTPDHTDVAVFQLMAFDREMPSVPDIDPGIDVETLDESLVIGYPFSRLQEGRALPQGVRGSVRRVGPKMIELDTPLHPGLSGAPVLDRQGRLLGMVVAVLQSEVYGVAIRAGALSEALAGGAEAVRREEVRLVAMGCDPGPVDGVFDRRTATAYECERDRSDRSTVDPDRDAPSPG
ncbi:MAG: trypsin-like peptidase domain-containing protein, partial [Gammaproteobacteria bacterium]